jgi:hypothetical protein
VKTAHELRFEREPFRWLNIASRAHGSRTGAVLVGVATVTLRVRSRATGAGRVKRAESLTGLCMLGRETNLPGCEVRFNRRYCSPRFYAAYRFWSPPMNDDPPIGCRSTSDATARGTPTERRDIEAHLHPFDVATCPNEVTNTSTLKVVWVITTCATG